MGGVSLYDTANTNPLGKLVSLVEIPEDDVFHYVIHFTFPSVSSPVQAQLVA